MVHKNHSVYTRHTPPPKLLLQPHLLFFPLLALFQPSHTDVTAFLEYTVNVNPEYSFTSELCSCWTFCLDHVSLLFPLRPTSPIPLLGQISTWLTLSLPSGCCSSVTLSERPSWNILDSYLPCPALFFYIEGNPVSCRKFQNVSSILRKTLINICQTNNFVREKMKDPQGTPSSNVALGDSCL